MGTPLIQSCQQKITEIISQCCHRCQCPNKKTKKIWRVDFSLFYPQNLNESQWWESPSFVSSTHRMRWQWNRTVCHMNKFSKTCTYLFLYTHSMYCKSNIILHHKVNEPCFFFYSPLIILNLKEWIHFVDP